ncbi:hypothetical protein HanXRQr2_Chr05g0221641 [Helianthus annuus]|uniref:Uncharacterized protein n=1 Tax=Helianthus annuus TaxID=4232 RepID=A0A9K3NN55_HELAN|nr:hypothetical protein HanXRQr2_Chr05g0221641 [Helianthus annuus]KAJ0923287.1 hypothetical protein HanPSC8_Chr05g0214111 [Helianthus annuus]
MNHVGFEPFILLCYVNKLVYSLIAFALKLYFNTCCRLINEVWMIDETSLGWTRYTPLIYLSLNVMLFVETMLYFHLQ